MENHSHADTNADDKSTKIVRLFGLIGGGVNRAYCLLCAQYPNASYCRRNPQAQLFEL